MARRAMTESDREQIAAFTRLRWGANFVMSQGRKFFPHMLDGIIDERDGEIVGLLTYRIDPNEGMEIMTLNSTLEGRGIGMALILDAIQVARDNDVSRLWVTTTNDNLKAMGLYQRIGFRLTQINMGAVDEARKIKTQIPEVGYLGIKVRDEIVMELELEPFLEDEGDTRTSSTEDN